MISAGCRDATVGEQRGALDERDMAFKADKPLSEYAKFAIALGHISD